VAHKDVQLHQGELPMKKIVVRAVAATAVAGGLLVAGESVSTAEPPPLADAGEATRGQCGAETPDKPDTPCPAHTPTTECCSATTMPPNTTPPTVPPTTAPPTTAPPTTAPPTTAPPVTMPPPAPPATVPPTTVARPSAGRALPVTGSSTAVLAGLGAGLLAMGMVLRRTSRWRARVSGGAGS
jgi:hypothetical protein